MREMNKKNLIRAVLLGGAAAAAATVAGAAVGYHIAFRGGKDHQVPVYEVPADKLLEPYREEIKENIRRVVETPYERVTIRSHDGLTLVGKLYEGKPGAPLLLFFHGYRSTAERDGSGAFQLGMEKGWNMLLVDQRAGGESGGKTITFGIRERFDCLAWAEYGAKRFGPETPIFLWGISMGAATVLMASDLELPASVRGIISDCGFDTPAGIIRETIRFRKWPMFPLYPFAALGARLFGGFSLTETSALDCVREANVPILLIHGEADTIVPCQMVHALHEACSAPVTVLTVPNAGHGISWYADMPAYHSALLRFLEENMA